MLAVYVYIEIILSSSNWYNQITSNIERSHTCFNNAVSNRSVIEDIADNQLF